MSRPRLKRALSVAGWHDGDVAPRIQCGGSTGAHPLLQRCVLKMNTNKVCNTYDA